MDRCVPEIVAEQAARRPNAVALRFGEEELRYHELDLAADRLARRLVRAGLGRGEVAAVLLERGIDLVVAALAVLKAAGAYTLLDPEFPPHRLETMLAETGARVLVTSAALSECCDAGRLGTTRLLMPSPDPGDEHASSYPDDSPLPRARPADPACVMFTSGSTGRPKGVLAPHRALTALVTSTRYCRITQDDVVLQASQVSWDLFAQELWGALARGATCVLQPGQRPDPARIAQLVEDHGVTVMYAAASLFNHLVDFHPAVLRGVEQMMTGGEPLSTPHVRRALAIHPALSLVNGYGPVETMVLSTVHPVTTRDLDRAAIPLGRPVPGDTLHVLDERLRPVPPGAVGEIYLGGIGLAHGYVGRGAATAERFVASPFGGPGARMYRTGDLGRLGPDGTLEYLGRSDRQLKLRGMRIEPGEIEAVLASRPELTQAVVRAVDETLVAYVVPSGVGAGTDGTVDPTVLRAYCRGRLPDHMVPQRFVVLAALPLTPSGKLDHSALPRPEHVGRADGRAPGTDLERLLHAMFAEVLGTEDFGVDQGFFELGGHSLAAARLAGRIRAELDQELDLRALFETPTVAGLAARLEGGAVARRSARSVKRVTRSRGADDPVPMPDAARRLWLLDRLEPGSAYTMPLLIRLRGQLDTDALRRAVGDLVERHEILRTRFADVDGELMMLLAAPEIVDELTSIACTPADLAATVARLSSRPFDLRTEAPFRANLLRLAADDHALLLVFHHIACDGWSLRPLLRDLSAAYVARRGSRAPFRETRVPQYADYALRQREDAVARSRALAAQLDYWREALADLPESSIDVPRPVPRPAHGERRAGLVSERLDAGVCESITRFARAHGATLFMALHAGLNALLTRYGAGPDIAIGTVTAGRGEPEFEDAVGFFVNTLVLRTRTDGDPDFAGLLRRSREAQFEAFAHADVPFDHLVSALRPARAAGRTPFFDTMLVLQNNLEAVLDSPGLTTEVDLPRTGTAKFDLVFEITEVRGVHSGELVVDLEFALDRFEPEVAADLLRAYVALLEAGAASPDLPISVLPLGAAERASPMGRQPPTVPLFLDLFADCVRRWPHADAVVCGDVRWSYAELDARSDALAARLRAHGVGRERVVATFLPKSADTPLAFLAVLKACGAYLPLDPDGEPSRAKATVADAGAVTVLATRATAARAADLGPGVIVLDDAAAPTGAARFTATRPSSGDLAYVIYTSGSTGVPKGVAVEHGTLANLAGATRSAFGLTERDRLLQWASPTFDASIWDFVMALTSGAAAHIAGPDERVGPALAARLRASAITVALVTPSALATVPDDPASLPDLALLILGGEAVPPVLADRWASGRRLVNAYGPTEATVCATIADLAPHRPVVIGRALDRTRVYVLDERLQPAAPGARGEIYLGGGGVARGYLARPGTSAERFVPDPFGPAGSRMYRTGDLARFTPDGRLEFLGRGDDQIKIRGFRIELGEIETALGAHPGVGQTAVLAHRFPGEEVPRLVAYLTPATDAALSGPARTPADDALRRWLAERLPPYMVPASFVRLDTLPAGAAGKLDRTALPPPDPATPPAADDQAPDPPRTPTESLVARVWAELLHLPSSRLGVYEDFFTLGGDSLSAVRLAARLESDLGRAVSAAQIFRTPTVAGLAAYLDASTSASGAAPSSLEPIPRQARRPRPRPEHGEE